MVFPLVPPDGIEPHIHRPLVYSELDIPVSCLSGYLSQCQLPLLYPLQPVNLFLLANLETT